MLFRSVDSIEIDYDNLTEILITYLAGLTSAQNEMKRRMPKNPAGCRTKISTPCSCRENPASPPPEASVQNIKNREHWSYWQNKIGRELDNYVNRAYESLSNCRETYRQKYGAVIEREEDLRAARIDCEKELNTLRNKIQKKNICVIGHDWLPESAGFSRQVTDFFVTKLSFVELLLTIFAGLGLLAGPYLGTLWPKRGTTLFTEPPALFCLLAMFVLALAAAGFLGLVRAYKFRKALKSALALYKQIIKNMRSLFESNKSYLSLVCRLGMAVQNLESLDTALQDAQIERDILNYIETTSARYQKEMSFFMPRRDYESNSSQSMSVSFTTEPPFRQEAFAPAHYSKAATVTCHVGTAKEQFDLNIPGLTAITMAINPQQPSTTTP